MSVNSVSVGKDVTLDLVTQSGAVNFGLLTSFSAKQDVTSLKVKGLDGSTIPIVLYDAWSGSFEYERVDASLDNYFAAQEEAYFAGNTTETLYITESITNPDGTPSQFQFQNVVLTYDDAGMWKTDSTVKQKVNFVAARRKRIV